MDLTTHVDRLQDELARLAGAGVEEASPVVERLLGGVESAVRLVLLEALAEAADEITAELAPGSVQVRLRGRDPVFVVTAPAIEQAFEDAAQVPAGDDLAPPTPTPDDGEAGGATARINLRLPEALKTQVEHAASRERLSINTWLVRAVEAGLHPRRGAPSMPSSRIGGQRFTGWVR